MNTLLARQLRKHLPASVEAPAGFERLLDAVSAAYDELEGDRRLLEHTLQVTSEELNEANERLRRESEGKLLRQSIHYLHTLECQQGMIMRVRRTPGGYLHTLCRGRLALRLGFTPERVEGRLPREFLDEERAAALDRIYGRLWEGDDGAIEHQIPGSPVIMLAQFELLREEGRVVEVIISAVDITDRKHTELALLAAKEKAELADRAKSEFLAVMSHEIRTPLNAVLGFNSLLESSPLNPEQLSWVETINQSGRSLLSLLNDILDFSKMEAGELSLCPQPIPLKSSVESVVDLYRQAAAERGVELRLQLSPQLPDVIGTDPSRLRQILVNLLSNAVKFTHHGTIQVAVSVSAANPAGNSALLNIDVSDSGIGIPPHLHHRIFKPFSQADASSTRQYGGTGLGLAISQRLARALGGDITFTSEAGRGTTFSLTIRAELVGGYSFPSSGSASKPSSTLRVLVAEDHPHNRDLLTRILNSHGIKPDLAENGHDAAQAAMHKPYDVIFMDVRMPGMDGLVATRLIRSGLLGLRPPRIVAVTANAFDEEKRNCFEAGMDSVVVKPFIIADILRELQIVSGQQT